MPLWCPIKKRMGIIMKIRVLLFWLINFDSMENVGKKSFSYEANVSLSFIPIRRICLLCLIMKRKDIITCIHICHYWQTNFDSKKWWKEKVFLWNQCVNVIYPNEENVFIVPNHEKKGDHYMYPCLSQLMDKLWF